MTEIEIEYYKKQWFNFLMKGNVYGGEVSLEDFIADSQRNILNKKLKKIRKL